MRILFIHGRAQENFTLKELLNTWTNSLQKSYETAGLEYPDFKISLPHYGKELIKLRDTYLQDIKNGKYQMKSAAENDRLKIFHSELIDDLRKNAGITEKQLSEQDKSDKQERGWKNWKFTLAAARLLDNFFESFTNKNILRETDDVVTYLVVPTARETITKILIDALTYEPTIIIAHSLGTVIAYDVLHKLSNDKNYDIKGLITLGSPLGVNAIIRQLDPFPTYPPLLKGNWINIYDKCDLVSLRPLEAGHFKVIPEINNYDVINETDNRHGIEGYLSNAIISKYMNEII